LVGCGLSCWFERISRVERAALNVPAVSTRVRWLRCAVLMLATAALFGGLHWAEHGARVLGESIEGAFPLGPRVHCALASCFNVSRHVLNIPSFQDYLWTAAAVAGGLRRAS